MGGSSQYSGRVMKSTENTDGNEWKKDLSIPGTPHRCHSSSPGSLGSSAALGHPPEGHQLPRYLGREEECGFESRSAGWCPGGIELYVYSCCHILTHFYCCGSSHPLDVPVSSWCSTSSLLTRFLLSVPRGYPKVLHSWKPESPVLQWIISSGYCRFISKNCCCIYTECPVLIFAIWVTYLEFL